MRDVFTLAKLKASLDEESEDEMRMLGWAAMLFVLFTVVIPFLGAFVAVFLMDNTGFLSVCGG